MNATSAQQACRRPSVVARAAGGACDDGDPCVGEDRCDGEGRCVGTVPTCAVGERCDAGACASLVCEGCETDADCAGGICAALDGAARCLLPCEDANDCGEGDTCEAVGAGAALVCVPAERCQTAVEPGPDAAADDVSTGAELGDDVSTGADAGDDVSGGADVGTVGEGSGGGCGGGGHGHAVLLVGLAALVVWRRRASHRIS